MTALVITRLDDELVAKIGEPVTSRYCETFWLPILGPTAVWLLRHAAYRTVEAPWTVDTEVLGSLLGVGGAGPNSPVVKTLHRLEHFDCARHDGDAWALRAELAPLPVRHVRRLPDELQAAHAAVLAAGPSWWPISGGWYAGPPCPRCESTTEWAVDENGPYCVSAACRATHGAVA